MVSPTPFVVPEYRPASAFNPSSRTLHLSGSSAHGNMDGRPRPLEPDLNSAGLSLPAQSPGFIDHLGDLHPAAAIHRSSHSTENYVRPSARNPIIDWYISQEKPWDPIQGRNPPPRAGDLRGNRLNIRPSGPAFSAYRESNVSSECESTGPGILPSDSGYESRTRQSVTNGSIYGDCDRSGETGSISSHLADFQLDRPNLPSESWKQQGFDQTTAVPANVDSSRLVCLYCNQSVKTKSELKKHKQKHEKPHHCDVPNCTRTIGFSTPNDLDRHKRSCHPELIPNGKYYRCTVQGCRNKDKKWPRADNFRSHLKRLHGFSPGDDALEAYVYREPPLSGDLASLGTSIGDGLIPMDITSHGSGLNPNNWQYLDSGISLQAIQHKITRDAGTTNYIGHHMDFQQNAVIAQQQLHALSPNGDTEQMQGTAMQMSPVELATENELAHLEESHEQPQDHQAPTETADTSSDDEFNGADFLNDDSVSEQDAAEDEGRDEIQNAEVDLSRVERPRQDVDRAVQSIQDGNETTSSEPEDIESPDNATVQEYYPPPHPISSSPTTSTKAGTQSMSNDAVVIAQPDYAAVEELSVHGLDIVNDKSKASDLIKALEDKGTLAELLEQLGYQKSRATNATTRTTPSVRSLASDSCQVTCNEPNCRKVFPRPCELKKHQKRHEKPYGCTFPKCSKRFGSKNDWKRHENSQHHQLELWKCDEPSKTDPKDVCGRACHRREQFKIHLLRDHEICDQGTIDSKLEKCRVGRNCETRFWCGFCKMIVEIQDGGRNAWTERFNHIDDHFSGRSYVKMDISEWKSMDPDTNDIDLNLAGPSSGPSLGVDNGLKRSADAEAQQPRSRNKRPRAIETLWFCCHCGNQSLTSTSMNCCMDDCNGHIKCNACRVERVPREPQVLLQELQE